MGLLTLWGLGIWRSALAVKIEETGTLGPVRGSNFNVPDGNLFYLILPDLNPPRNKKHKLKEEKFILIKSKYMSCAAVGKLVVDWKKRS